MLCRADVLPFLYYMNCGPDICMVVHVAPRSCATSVHSNVPHQMMCLNLQRRASKAAHTFSPKYIHLIKGVSIRELESTWKLLVVSELWTKSSRVINFGTYILPASIYNKVGRQDTRYTKSKDNVAPLSTISLLEGSSFRL